MKAGWERSNEWIIPDVETVSHMLQPVLKGRQITQITPLNGGLSHSNVSITTRDQEKYVLRINSKPDTSMAVETAVLKEMKGRVPVPEVLYADFSCSTFKAPLTLLSWVPGRQLSEVMDKTPGHTNRAASETGKMLARIHNVTFPSSGFLDENLMINDTITMDRHQFINFIEDMIKEGHVAKHAGHELSQDVLTFANQQAYLIDSLGQHHTLVHSDFNPLNILVEERGSQLDITAILDWEFAMSGSPLMDIGNILRYENPTNSAFLPSFISSYLDHGGVLPDKWLQKAKLLDLIALCDLLNKDKCDEVRIRDLKQLILNTMKQWEQYECIQETFVSP
ncbi:phosphotransferase family protein [Thalassobacillus sp. CUG 92003]|uniref:phosphotransferase family protein n=1 Tax=Thalassobacillus sp. CUG 92003 TaxID=2736641 RepID=UPI0015E6993E|nr:phosphotransferase [Thalassobacillus sp. CUG 92003]